LGIRPPRRDDPQGLKADSLRLWHLVAVGLLAISGFDVIAPIAEETRAPRRLIPLATILLTVIPGVFWMLTPYAVVVAVPVGVMSASSWRRARSAPCARSPTATSAGPRSWCP
jgi:amino acid transporter